MPWGPNFVKMGTQFLVKWGPNGDLRQQNGDPKSALTETSLFVEIKGKQFWTKLFTECGVI